MSDVPARFPVSINDRPYQLLLTQDYQRGSPTSQRPTMDTSRRAAGGSIATGIAWRRSQQDWSGGSGQLRFDEDSNTSTSDESRFWRSVGVDIWTRRELKGLVASVAYPLGGTAPARPTMVALPDVGSYGTIYMSSGTVAPGIRRLTGTFAIPASGATVDAVTGVATCNVLATDGSRVFAATNTGVYSVSGTTATVLAVVSTAAHNFVSVCNGRLLAAKTTGELYEYSVSGTTGTATTTFVGAPAATTWDTATGTTKAILVAGHVGRTSTIYRIGYNESTGALNVALTPATDFPTGEVINALRWHMGWLLIGTSRGLRIGTVDQVGNVTYGPVIDTVGAVYDFAGDDRYVWFTWQVASSMFEDNGSSDSTTLQPGGTGRIDLGNFVQPLQPAYATDLVDVDENLPRANDVTAVVRMNDKTWFAADGVAKFFTDRQDGGLAAGWIESSLIEFGFEGQKIATDVEIRHSSDQGNMAVTLKTEDGAATVLGTLGTAGTFQSDQPIPAQHITSEAHRIRLDFLADYTSAVLADNPISYWGIQEPSGSTVTDSQGLHNGTLTNITLNQVGPSTALPKGGALAAGSPIINFGDHTEYEFTGDFTLEGWFFADGAEASSMWIAKYAVAAPHHYEYALLFELNSLRAAVYDDSGTGSTYLSVHAPPGLLAGWHHVVFAVEGTQVHLYVDGIAIDGTSSSATLFSGDPSLTTFHGPTGTRAPGSTGVLHVAGLAGVGYEIAGVAIYDYALPASSAAAHHSAVSLDAFDAEIRRWALRAVPVARTYEVIQAPLILHEDVQLDQGEQYAFDTLAEYQALLALKESRQIVEYNELGNIANVVIDAVTLGNVQRANEKDGLKHHFDATLLVTMWTV